MPRPRSHALRRGRWSEAGGIYLLTFVTDRRRARFSDWDCASRASRARYVVANPIRAGISRSVGGYPYWNAVWISADADPAM